MSAEIEKYIETIPPERRKRFDSIHHLILNLFPDAVVDMKYKMPTYSVGDGWVAVANQKNYISFYTCGPHHIESFKTNNPGIKTGKGCINFKDRDELPNKKHRRDNNAYLHQWYNFHSTVYLSPWTDSGAACGE